MDSQIIKKSTAFINSNGSVGTGYLVSEDLVITCAHVVNDSEPAQINLKFWNEFDISQSIENKEGEKINVERIYIDEQKDIAILQLSKPVNQRPLSFANINYKEGIMKIFGYPNQALGGGIWISGELRDNEAIQVIRNEEKYPALQIYSSDIHQEPPQGFSGSPIFVDGKIVGHLRSIIPNRETSLPSAMFGVIYAVRGSDINEFLCENFHERFNPPIRVRPQPLMQGFNPNWYVNRKDNENLAINTLNEGGTITVQGAYLTGKSTFVNYVLSQITEKKIIYVNMRLFDEDAFSSIEKLIKTVAKRIFKELQLSEHLVIQEWDDSELTLASQNLRNVIEKHILNENNDKFIIAFDNTDKVFTSKLNNSFYGIMRGLIDEHDPSWKNVKFIFSISTSPPNLIDDPNMSPFDGSVPINLEDITREEFLELLEKFNLGKDLTEEDIINIFDWVGGNPYLWRALCFYSWATEIKLIDTLSEKTMKNIFSSYLAKLEHWLNRNQPLMDELKRFENEATLKGDDKKRCQKLEMAGLLKEVENNRYKLRCKLYECLF